jgi:hypothetical protein
LPEKGTTTRERERDNFFLCLHIYVFLYFIYVDQYLVFEGVVLLSVGHGAALEPAVKHLVDALQISRLALDHNVVDALTVKVLNRQTHAYHIDNVRGCCAFLKK